MSGCRYLSKSQIPITLEKAVSSGLTPCSVCKPPTLDVKSQNLNRMNIEGNENIKDVDNSRILQTQVSSIVDGDTLVVQITDSPETVGSEG